MYSDVQGSRVHATAGTCEDLCVSNRVVRNSESEGGARNQKGVWVSQLSRE